MDKVELKIVGMTYSHAGTGAYALILGEVAGNRRIPIIIAGGEAQSIAVEMDGLKPPRPLTHDLFKNFAEIYNISLEEVVIDDFIEGVFYAKLFCKDSSGKLDIIDSRTSDAVALAIRFGCPIYTFESIIKKTGVSLQKLEKEAESEKEEEESVDAYIENTDKGEDLANYSLAQLKELIEKAIAKEDYEYASVLQKEINRREEE